MGYHGNFELNKITHACLIEAIRGERRNMNKSYLGTMEKIGEVDISAIHGGGEMSREFQDIVDYHVTSADHIHSMDDLTHGIICGFALGMLYMEKKAKEEGN